MKKRYVKRLLALVTAGAMMTALSGILYAEEFEESAVTSAYIEEPAAAAPAESTPISENTQPAESTQPAEEVNHTEPAAAPEAAVQEMNADNSASSELSDVISTEESKDETQDDAGEGTDQGSDLPDLGSDPLLPDLGGVPYNEDVTVRPVEPGEPANLVIVYYLDTSFGGMAAPEFNAVYPAGSAYSVASPKVTGYTPVLERVEGTLNSDTVINVIYHRNSHLVTVNYVDENGNSVAPAYQETVLYGDTYSAASPAVAGYKAELSSAEGTMPDRDVQITVIYVKESIRTAASEKSAPAAQETAPAQQEETGSVIEIEDYNTPLGLGGLSMNSGVCLE